MKPEKSSDDKFACFVGSLNLSGLTGPKIILWLIAITVVSFVIGFGILAITGDLGPSAGNPSVPFRHSAMASPNTTSFALDGTTRGTIGVMMGAGELTVRGGTPGGILAESTVFSKAPEWQPDYLRTFNGSVQTVTITEKGHHGKEWFAVDSPNNWEIALSGDVPLDLKVDMGAGDCTVDLDGLDLGSLVVRNGAGETTVRLERYRGRPFTGDIHQGIGDFALTVARGSNARITVYQGVGDISAHGFVQNGMEYAPAGFNPAAPVSEIRINQGVGDITLEVVP